MLLVLKPAGVPLQLPGALSSVLNPAAATMPLPARVGEFPLTPDRWRRGAWRSDAHRRDAAVGLGGGGTCMPPEMTDSLSFFFTQSRGDPETWEERVLVTEHPNAQRLPLENFCVQCGYASPPPPPRLPPGVSYLCANINQSTPVSCSLASFNVDLEAKGAEKRSSGMIGDACAVTNQMAPGARARSG